MLIKHGNNILSYNSKVLSFLDEDALFFINAHNLNTGALMGAVQMIAINNRYLRYKNIIVTPNGSNLWNLFNSKSVKPRIWIHCPINNTTANALAYQIEFLSKSPVGTFNNFVGGDFTANGVTGGAIKYFDAGIAPSSYPQNDFCFGFYNRDSSQINQFEAGSIATTGIANYNTIAIRRIGASATFHRANESAASAGVATVSAGNSLGLITETRSSSVDEALYKGNTALLSRIAGTSTPSNFNMYFNNANVDGSATSGGIRQLASYFMGLPHLTSNQRADMHWIENLYHTEIITGGRQV